MPPGGGRGEAKTLCKFRKFCSQFELMPKKKGSEENRLCTLQRSCQNLRKTPKKIIGNVCMGFCKENFKMFLEITKNGHRKFLRMPSPVVKPSPPLRILVFHFATDLFIQ